MKERINGKTQEQAAVKANVRSRKTVQKYECRFRGHLNTDYGKI
ncbi:MAG: hypothetical protein ABFD59_09685 [Smithella sp.]